MKWLGIGIVGAGMTFIVFASGARFLPLKLESAPIVDVRDHVSVRTQKRPARYMDLYSGDCFLPFYEPLTYTNVKPPLPAFTKIDLKGSIVWNSSMTVTDHAPWQSPTRIVPVMPRAATKSGHCLMKFDVDEKGNTFNIKTTFCTEELFASPSIKSVSRWHYPPKIVDGLAAARKDIETKISYKLMDVDGSLLPE